MRKLKAIEIAEGALLVDIALVFQVIALLLPTGGTVFYMLVCIVFGLVVLRHGIYVGIMSMLVGLFVVSMLSGPQLLFLVVLEGMGGIFLGMTMRWRWHPVPLVILGASCGALALSLLIVGLSWVLGVPMDATIRSLHRLYNDAVGFLGMLVNGIGQGTWWRQQGLPMMSKLGMLAFRYWWITLYAMLFGTLLPVVGSIYVAANTTMRLLGHDVRPLFGGRVSRWLRGMLRRALRQRIRAQRLRRLGGRI